jgi:hypothetical protein
MELIYREMPLDYEFYDTSDAHYGPYNHHREAFLEIINQVAERPNRYMWHKGDGVDCVTPGDKRFSTVSADVRKGWRNPMDHADQLVRDMLPIRERILTYMVGNHEYHLINTVDVAGYICEALQVPWGGVICKFVALHNRKVQHKFLLWHGRGSLPKGAKDPIQREGNRKAHLKRKLESLGHTDCIYQTMGHTHQLIAVEPTINQELMLTDNRKGLKQQRRHHTKQNAAYIPPEARYYGNSGSFLRLYSKPGQRSIGYGEIAGYAPAEIGCLKGYVQGGELQHVEKVVL